MFKIKYKLESLNEKDKEDTTVNEAIQTVYTLNDKIILIWNNSEVSLSMKYDIGDSWIEILDMIKKLKSHETKFKMQWPSQSFWVLWEFLEISETELEIKANWHYEVDSFIQVNRAVFITEWEKLITKVNKDLKRQGYILENLENS
jgi:hypothetical protein